MSSSKTTDICDACAQAQACELAFISLGRRRAFSGAIRTLRYDQGISAIRDLLRQRGNGQVLVIDGAGLPWRALFGDLLAALAVRSGWEGVIVHGAIRDRVEIDAMDIGVKAIATAPRRADMRGPGELDVPVIFGNAIFTPGAHVLADEDGVVVLPAGLSEADIPVSEARAATSAYAAGGAVPGTGG